MSPDPRSEIQELVRRLMMKEYRDADIREAAEVIASLQVHDESAGMGEEFLASPFAQVQKLGFFLLDSVAAQAPRARAILSRAEIAAQRKKLLEGSPLVAVPPPRNLGQAGMAEIIKMWIREEKPQRPKRPPDWLPRR